MLDLYTMGERIRQAREDMGYTRETFSEMANITPRFCYDIESGKKGVSIDTLKNICEALNLSADHLLDLKPLDTDAYDYTIFHVLMEQCPNSYRDGLYRVMSCICPVCFRSIEKRRFLIRFSSHHEIFFSFLLFLCFLFLTNPV